MPVKSLFISLSALCPDLPAADCGLNRLDDFLMQFARYLNLIALTVSLVSQAAPAHALTAALFGTAEFRAESHAALPKWDRVLDGISQEASQYKACRNNYDDCPSRAVMAWQALLKGLEGENSEQQIREVNRFFNQVEYRADDVNFGMSDYWATPLEFMAYAGDCEDYVIAKYVSLRQLGFPASSLRMVVVQDTLRDLAHAVLAVYVDDDVFILDNLTNAVLSHDRIFQYSPYYSVNEEARWAHVPASRLVMSAAQ